MLSVHWLSLVTGLIFTASTSLLATDWPQWRGPDRNGISSEKEWAGQWPQNGPQILWKASVGLGFSSVVVADSRAFTVGHADDKDSVFCFDVTTGKVLWKHSYASDLGDKYFDGGTTGSPTVDAGRVFWLSRWGDAFCLVPVDEPLQAEVRVKNEDVGFVHEGQAVKVKLAAYPFQKYGMVTGTITHVGADANDGQGTHNQNRSGATESANNQQQSTYKAIVTLQSQGLEARGKRFQMTPGMQVVAEINQGTRTVMEYLLSPVQGVFQEAARER